MSGDVYEGRVADDCALMGTISCYVNDNINNIPTESTPSVGGNVKKRALSECSFYVFSPDPLNYKLWAKDSASDSWLILPTSIIR